MKRYLLLLLLPVICSCTIKSVRKEIHGNINVEITTIERERILASGHEFIGLKTQLYYKDQKFDFDELAANWLKSAGKPTENISLLQVFPSLSQPKTLFYCKWASATSTFVSYLKDNGSGLLLIPLLKETEKAPLPILDEMDTLNTREVLYANYIIDEQKRTITDSLPVISNYYQTANSDSTNFDSYANILYSVSPDQKIIVRSCAPSMMSSYPELARLFMTERSTGKTTELDLRNNGKSLVEIFNEHLDHEQTPKRWFSQNFEWTTAQQGYHLKIKDKSAGSVQGY